MPVIPNLFDNESLVVDDLFSDKKDRKETEISVPKKSLGLKGMTIEEQAKAQNIGAISRLSGERLSDVEKQYEGKTPESGLKRTFDIGMYRDPTSKQLVQTLADVPIKSAITAGLLTNPLPTALGLAAGYPIFKGLDIASQKAVEKLPENTPSEIKDLAGTTGFLGSLAVGGKVTSGLANKIQPKIESASSNLASRIVNSLIKPSKSGRAFGKNPGEGIAKEGIFGFTLEGIKTKVDMRLNEIKNKIDDIKISKPDTKIDLGRNILEPLYKLRNKWADNPRSHTAEIKRVQEHIDDIIMNPDGTYRKLKGLSIDSAYKIKYMLRDMQKWARESKPDEEVDIALKNTYHNIDAKLDTTLPEVKQLNERMADLISASKALKDRIDWQNQQPVTPENIFQTANLPYKILQKPILKTGVASLLSTKYPKLNQPSP